MKFSHEKKFGILFFIVFSIIGFWPILSLNPIRIWSLLLATIFLTISFAKPSLLRPFNKIWIRFGEILGHYISPIVMFIIFFLILTPLSLIVRIFKRDLLNLNFSKKKNSYWVKRDGNLGSMDKQY